MLGADVCTKVEGPNVACRPCAYLHSDHDHTPCNPDASTYVACADTPGKWADKKCGKKLRKGKCRKRSVKANCQKTCGLCVG